MPGIQLATALKKEINNSLKANVIEMETQGDWWDPRPFKAILTLNPFVLLERLIAVVPAVGKWVPPQMVHHLARIELTTLGGCLNVDLNWKHDR